MPITVVCPQCEARLSAPEEASGLPVQCPRCGTTFDAPAVPTVPAGAVQATPPLPLVTAVPVLIDEESGRGARARSRPGWEGGRPRRARSRRREDDLALADTGLQTGLGIAALVVGVLGAGVTFLPRMTVLGLVTCGAGVILGMVALVVGLARGRRGLGLPVAGVSVSGAALVVAGTWLVVLGLIEQSRAAAEQAQLARTQRQQQQWVIPGGQFPPGGMWLPPGQNPGPGVPAGPPMQNPVPVGPPTAPAGVLVLKNGVGEVNAQLTQADPKDRSRFTCYCKVYTVSLKGGKTYRIDLMSNQFDSYLRLEDAAGNPLAEDDDSGGNFNSLLLFPCPRDGTYRLVATTFEPAGGAFTLRVTEQH
jgi:hypothetical protein